MNSEDIIVSVLMLSYNHEDTIARAIEGVIKQKTKYRYELIIGDDASTDKSQSIILDYAKRYADIIIPVCRQKNLGANRNSYDLVRRSHGEYIAVCEGDDYWIYEHKLDEQIAFLERNTDYSACYTRCKMMIEGKEYGYPFSECDSISVEDMLNGGDVKRYATCTLIYRNLFIQNSNLLNYLSEGEIGDIVIQTILIKYGKIHYYDKDTAVYDKKIVTGTSFSTKTLQQQISSIRKTLEVCKNISGNEYHNLWDIYLAGFNVALFWEKKNTSVFEAIKWIIDLDIKERKALMRKLKFDYLQAKKYRAIKN